MHASTMGNLDYGVIILFSALVVTCGLLFARSGRNMSSFFAAGGALPWWMSGLSLFMSFFSAGTFVVWGSIAYSSGWVAVTIQWVMSISGFIIGFVIAPRWNKTKVLTAAEFITRRLGYRTQKIYTYLFLFISLFTTGAFLYPVAKIVEVSTGIPIMASIIILGILILVYTAVGGLWAVIVTDVLQFVVLTSAVLIVVPLAFGKVGGIANFLSQAPDDFFGLVNDEYTAGFIIAFGLYNLFFIAGNWAYVQRYTSVATPGDARKVGWTFGALYAISPVVWMLPPMIYRILDPSLDGLANEGAYLLMCKEVLPVGMLGLMLGGMIFATSSSVNTTLNISAGVIANDLFRHLRPGAPGKQLVKVGRMATILLGLITIFIALMVPFMGGIVEVVISLGAITGGAMFLPPIWSLFSRYLTGKGALNVTIISLIMNAFFKFGMPLLFDHAFSRAVEMIVGVGIPIGLLSVLEIYANLRNAVSKDFIVYRNAFEKKVSEVPVEEHTMENKKGGRVIGLGVSATGLIITVLSLIEKQENLFTLGMGAMVLLIGFLIIWYNLKA